MTGAVAGLTDVMRLSLLVTNKDPESPGRDHLGGPAGMEPHNRDYSTPSKFIHGPKMGIDENDFFLNELGQ